MKTWLWILFCSIILPRDVASFAAPSSRTHHLNHGRQNSVCRHGQLLFASPTSPKEDIWVPPSQQLLETRSKVFKIKDPEDLLHFISEDDRLCVVKVYASWCAACKKFDLRYRKLASKFGDKYSDAKGSQAAIKQKGRVRFAEIQYDKPQNQDLCDSLFNTTSFPYILIYKGQKGKVRGFHCTPSKFQLLANAVDELLAEEDGSLDEEFQKHVIDLGLADRR